MTRSWELSYYLVAYLDILGQSEQLLQLIRLPSGQQEEESAARILHNTAGHVVSLREAFQQFFQAASRSTGLLDDLAPAQREMADRMRQSQVEIRFFSDSLLLVVPLANTDEHCVPMNGVYSSMFAICGMYVVALASGRPFRGGIDIGLATRIPPHQEVYGPALVRAVKLESEAEYPRVVVGDALWSYVSRVAAQESASPFGAAASRTAASCKVLVATDQDDRHILDVIGTEPHSIENGISRQLVEAGYKFVVKAQNQYQAHGDGDLYQRYRRLRQYMESRLHLWGIRVAGG